MNSSIIKIIGMAIISIIIVILFSQIHEVTHKQIGSYYGCDGNIQWDFLDSNTYIKLINGDNAAFMSTHWDTNCEQTESQVLAHSINEVIGYNVMLVLELILILLISNTMFRIEKESISIEVHDKTKEANVEVRTNGVITENKKESGKIEFYTDDGTRI